MHYTAAGAIPAGIVTTIEAHRRALTKHLRAQTEKPILGQPRIDAEPADPRTATAVAVLTESTETDNDLRRRKSSPDLAVDFLEAVEALLVTVKDERPPVLRTPQLKRDLKATEAALRVYRAALLPDDPGSSAVGESLADQYRRLRDVN